MTLIDGMSAIVLVAVVFVFVGAVFGALRTSQLQLL
jgi:hypothetical protein